MGKRKRDGETDREREGESGSSRLSMRRVQRLALSDRANGTQLPPVFILPTTDSSLSFRSILVSRRCTLSSSSSRPSPLSPIWNRINEETTQPRHDPFLEQRLRVTMMIHVLVLFSLVSRGHDYYLPAVSSSFPLDSGLHLIRFLFRFFLKSNWSTET